MEHSRIRAIQAGMMAYPVNSFAPRGITQPLPGIRVTADLPYGETYPNSYFDLYTPPRPGTGAAPGRSCWPTASTTRAWRAMRSTPKC